MRVAKVRLSNILGIQELEFEAGQFTAFTGQNGSGKTSALSAIKAVLGRDDVDSDATLLRRGAEVGEAVILMDDGTEITKRITPTGSKTTISGADGKVSAPSNVLRGLTDAMSVNPVQFIRSGDTPAEKRQRLQWLLECLPVTIDRDRFEQIAGAAIKASDPNWAPFDQIEAVRKTIFDDRTATNRAIDEKKGSINQLEQTLPENEEGQVAGDPDQVQAQLDQMDANNNADIQAVDGRLADYERESGERLAAINEKYDGKIAALRQQISELEVEKGREAGDERQWMAEARTKAANRKSEIRIAHAEARQPHVTTLAAIRAGANAVAKAAQTRAHIREFETGISALETDAAKMTERLKGLQAYKSELLSNIPVDGLTVEDGEIYRNGVPFNRLNTAQQIDLAVEISKLRASRAGIICVDGIENLDSEQYDIFREKCLESGLQLFVTRVTDDAFAIETEA